VAVDTDSNPNLGMSLGLDEPTAAEAPLVPRELAIGTGGDTTPAQLLADYGVATPSA
jgi:CO dehydrogenase maturation factor